MSDITTTLKNIKYTNIHNKKLGTQLGSRITQATFNEINTIEFLNSPNFYKIVDAIDIDWNGIEIDNNTIINDTSDLINFILSLKAEINMLKEKVNRLENDGSDDISDDETGDDDNEFQSLNATYDSNGETQLYNI